MLKIRRINGETSLKGTNGNPKKKWRKGEIHYEWQRGCLWVHRRWLFVAPWGISSLAGVVSSLMAQIKKLLLDVASRKRAKDIRSRAFGADTEQIHARKFRSRNKVGT